MKRLLILAVVLAGPVLAALPEPMPRWTAAGAGAGGGQIEIDRASLTWRAMQRAWWRIGYAPAKRDGTAEDVVFSPVDDGHPP